MPSITDKLRALQQSNIAISPFETEDMAIQRLKNRSLMRKFYGDLNQIMEHRVPGASISAGDVVSFGLNASPFVGDAIAIDDAKRELRQGNYGMAAFNAATALPVIGDIGAAMKLSMPALASLGGIVGMMRRGAKSLPSPAGAIGRQRGIIGGINAKAADPKSLKAAADMDAAGVSREQIWDETGWFKGLDGKWRFEIDDSQAVINKVIADDEVFYGGVGRGLDHYKLYRNYPDTTDINLSIDKRYENLGETRGKYTPYINRESEGLFDINEEISVNRPDNITAKSTLLHELQHGVQHREGFSAGGSAQDFYSELLERKQNAEATINQINDMMRENVRIRDRLIEQGADKVRLKPYEDEYQKFIGMKMDLIDDAQIDIGESAYKKYKALSGEVEARAVQARINLTPEERAARPFWLDYDMPEAEQIIK